MGRDCNLLNGANAITAVSKFQARELGKDFASGRQHDPNLTGATAGTGQPSRTDERCPHTGRIELNKGSLELLRSVNQVASQFPAVEYVMAGGRHNSINERSLEKALGRNGTRNHVRLLGHVPWQELADLYRRARVFVMPSYYETFGISVIEAMAFGLPVVAANVGGLPEVVEDGVTGILVPPKDSEALAEALVRLLRDPDLCARMGRAGRERVRSEFTVDRIVSQTLDVYQSVIRN